MIFGLIFQALLPVSALLFASGMVQDDIEEQTLTYFLIRPIPRWVIYLAKLLGTFVVTAIRPRSSSSRRSSRSTGATIAW